MSTQNSIEIIGENIPFISFIVNCVWNHSTDICSFMQFSIMYILLLAWILDTEYKITKKVKFCLENAYNSNIYLLFIYKFLPFSFFPSFLPSFPLTVYPFDKYFCNVWIHSTWCIFIRGENWIWKRNVVDNVAREYLRESPSPFLFFWPVPKVQTYLFCWISYSA